MFGVRIQPLSISAWPNLAIRLFPTRVSELDQSSRALPFKNSLHYLRFRSRFLLARRNRLELPYSSSCLHSFAGLTMVLPLNSGIISWHVLFLSARAFSAWRVEAGTGTVRYDPGLDFGD